MYTKFSIPPTPIENSTNYSLMNLYQKKNIIIQHHNIIHVGIFNSQNPQTQQNKKKMK